MRRVPDREFRFKLKFGLQRLAPSTVQQLTRGGADKREAALNRAADQLAAEFEGHEVYAPDPVGNHG